MCILGFFFLPFLPLYLHLCCFFFSVGFFFSTYCYSFLFVCLFVFCLFYDCCLSYTILFKVLLLLLFFEGGVLFLIFLRTLSGPKVWGSSEFPLLLRVFLCCVLFF